MLMNILVYRENKLQKWDQIGFFEGCIFCCCFLGFNFKIVTYSQTKGNFGPMQMQYYRTSIMEEKYPQVA